LERGNADVLTSPYLHATHAEEVGRSGVVDENAGVSRVVADVDTVVAVRFSTCGRIAQRRQAP
jgi:hypothetical protein